MIEAGGGAYYFAKVSIDADKKERFENQQKRQRLAASFEKQSMQAKPPKSKEAHDKQYPASLVAGEQEQSKTKERSKYEPSEVYRTRKGDRFS